MRTNSRHCWKWKICLTAAAAALLFGCPIINIIAIIIIDSTACVARLLLRFVPLHPRASEAAPATPINHLTTLPRLSHSICFHCNLNRNYYSRAELLLSMCFTCFRSKLPLDLAAFFVIIFASFLLLLFCLIFCFFIGFWSFFFAHTPKRRKYSITSSAVTQGTFRGFRDYFALRVERESFFSSSFACLLLALHHHTRRQKSGFFFFEFFIFAVSLPLACFKYSLLLHQPHLR